MTINNLARAAAATRKRRKTWALYYDAELNSACVMSPRDAGDVQHVTGCNLQYICPADRPMSEAEIVDTIEYTLNLYEYKRRYR